MRWKLKHPTIQYFIALLFSLATRTSRGMGLRADINELGFNAQESQHTEYGDCST